MGRRPKLPPAVEMVLFDIGGVLLDPRAVLSMRALASIENERQLWQRWLGCPWVRALETGRCSGLEFARGVVSDWKLSLSPEDFLQQFRTWPLIPYPGAQDLVGEVKRNVATGCFSNTNAVRWEQLSSWPMIGLFDPRFLSFEMGLLKPDREAFDHVVARLDARADRVLFLDDSASNVAAARDAGLAGWLVAGVDDARDTLIDAGVLDAA